MVPFPIFEGDSIGLDFFCANNPGVGRFVAPSEGEFFAQALVGVIELNSEAGFFE